MRPEPSRDRVNYDRSGSRSESRYRADLEDRYAALGTPHRPPSRGQQAAAVAVVIALILLALYGVSLVEWVTAVLNPQEGPCVPVNATLLEILGPSYPDQSLNGSVYRTGPSTGGVPHKRSLSPPCLITNAEGQAVQTLVEVHGVYLRNYSLALYDCSDRFKYVNGGGPYPNNRRFCDNVGDILVMGTSSGQVHLEFDQDWQAKGLCGPGVRSCDTAKISGYQSNGTVSLDIRGYVYWDEEHWELHPATAWKLSSDPVWP